MSTCHKKSMKYLYNKNVLFVTVGLLSQKVRSWLNCWVFKFLQISFSVNQSLENSQNKQPSVRVWRMKFIKKRSEECDGELHNSSIEIKGPGIDKKGLQSKIDARDELTELINLQKSNGSFEISNTHIQYALSNFPLLLS